MCWVKRPYLEASAEPQRRQQDAVAAHNVQGGREALVVHASSLPCNSKPVSPLLSAAGILAFRLNLRQSSLRHSTRLPVIMSAYRRVQALGSARGVGAIEVQLC